MVNIPLFTRLYTSQVVKDFFHQQYHMPPLISSNKKNYYALKHLEHLEEPPRFPVSPCFYQSLLFIHFLIDTISSESRPCIMATLSAVSPPGHKTVAYQADDRMLLSSTPKQ